MALKTVWCVLLAMSVLLCAEKTLAAESIMENTAKNKATNNASCQPWQAGFVERKQLRVGKIRINNGDVFDAALKAESTVLHKTVNALHIKTKPSVIRGQLLFHTDEVFSLEKLAESERNLRKNRYLHSADIRPHSVCGQYVNIDVTTKDNWTLTPGLSFSRTGGNNRMGIALQEHNILGYGKSLSFKYKKDEIRTEKKVYYKDYQFLHSHKVLFLDYQNNSDGKGYEVKLGLPFYYLDAPNAWQINATKITSQRTVYHAGDVTDTLVISPEKYSTSYGWLHKNTPNRLSRFRLGFSYRVKAYESSLNAADTFLAYHETAAYPWVKFETRQKNYIKKINYQHMGRVEDVFIGQAFSVSTGLLLEQFGSSSNHLLLSTKYRKGYAWNDDYLGLLNVSSSVLLGSGNSAFNQKAVLTTEVSLNHFNHQGRNWLLSGLVRAFDASEQEKQLYVGGGDYFLGYPKAFQTGNKLLALKAEKQVHFKWQPLQLVQFGTVFFSEAGSAWGQGNSFKWLADVGMGFRIVPLRSSRGASLHIDLGFPLIDGKNIDNMQVSIKASQTF